MNGFKYIYTRRYIDINMSAKMAKSFVEEVAKHEQMDILVDVIGVFFPRGEQVPEYCGEVFRLIQYKYHNEGKSPWSDKTYDCVCDIMKDYYNIAVDDVVGSEVSGGGAVSLPIFMGSMNKYKTEKEILLWKQKFGGLDQSYIVSAKLDGISALWVNGCLYTRGNGSQGQNISHLLPYLNMGVDVGGGGDVGGVGDVCVRGELIMKKSTFQKKYKTQYANARNLVCGVVNRNFEDHGVDIYKDIDFVTYDVYDGSIPYDEKFGLLSSLGHQVVEHACGLPSVSTYIGDKWLQTWKADLDYEIDGVIFTNHDVHIHPASGNPAFAFAYKNNDLCVNKVVGVVKQVHWNISKDRYLKPKIQLVSPIQCEQSNVEFVTGFNAKYILDNHICEGMQLLIGLSGNVIPHIFEVMGHEQGGGSAGDSTDDESFYFKEIQCSYEWSKNRVDLICNDTDNHLSCIKKNVQFFKAFEMKCNLQEKTLLNVHESLGVYRLKDILSLSLEEWMKVSKMGQKKAVGILGCLYDTLHWETVDASCYDYFLKLSVGLQTFERGFAAKKLKLFLDYLLSCGNEGFDICKCYEVPYIQNVRGEVLRLVEEEKPKQITVDTMKLFLTGLEQFVITLDELGEIPSEFRIVSAKTLMGGLSGSGSGKNKMKQYKFAFSGVRDKPMEAIMKSDGHLIEERVTKDVAMLIVKNDEVFTKPHSSKMKRASELDVPIYTIEEFNMWYKEYKELFA